MSFKTIISCIAIVCIVFLLSCYNVDYKKNNSNSTNENWWDGLTTEQKVKGMMIIGEMVAADKSSSCFNVYWDYPEEVEEPSFWELETLRIKIGGALPNLNDDEVWTSESDINITKTSLGDDSWRYSFIDTKDIAVDEYLVYYRIIMNDNNGNVYKNIISFVFLPDEWEIAIRAGESKASASSWLYFKAPAPEEGKKVFEKPLKNYESGTLSDTSGEFTIAPFAPVIFKIITDFYSKGWGWVYHYSNSSYCKIIPVSVSSDEIQLKYTFEDLPISQIQFEPTREFDYNDAIFYVSISKMQKR